MDDEVHFLVLNSNAHNSYSFSSVTIVDSTKNNSFVDIVLLDSIAGKMLYLPETVDKGSLFVTTRSNSILYKIEVIIKGGVRKFGTKTEIVVHENPNILAYDKENDLIYISHISYGVIDVYSVKEGEIIDSIVTMDNVMDMKYLEKDKSIVLSLSSANYLLLMKPFISTTNSKTEISFKKEKLYFNDSEVGLNQRSIAISADQDALFVSSRNLSSSSTETPGLIKYSLADKSTKWFLPLEGTLSELLSITINEKEFVVIASTNKMSILVVDPLNKSLVQKISLEEYDCYPYQLYHSKINNYLYASCFSGDKILPMDSSKILTFDGSEESKKALFKEVLGE